MLKHKKFSKALFIKISNIIIRIEFDSTKIQGKIDVLNLRDKEILENYFVKGNWHCILSSKKIINLFKIWLKKKKLENS